LLSMEPNPYAVSLNVFEQTVAVAPARRREMVGMPPESTPLSGDEACMVQWNAGGGLGPASDDGGGCDGD
ncbi:MAG: hypothetical protein QOH75_1427, partial [Actinomycetota bacterium]|nr:hypothetical protein [Actinomycetota bacterium]